MKIPEIVLCDVANLMSSSFDTSRISPDSYNAEVKTSNFGEITATASLLRNFEFEHPFAELETAGFNCYDKNVCSAKYFGFTRKTENSAGIRSQMRILYHEAIEAPEQWDEEIPWEVEDARQGRFALSIKSKQRDLIILVSDPERYHRTNVLFARTAKRAKEYVENGGRRNMKADDEFRMPTLNISAHDEFKNLKGIEIDLDNTHGRIASARQDTSFALNRTGGHIESEFKVIALDFSEPRLHFNFDREFVIFVADCSTPKNYEAYLEDDWKHIVPYMAARVSGTPWFD